MPFLFKLPTTGNVLYSDFFGSSTHPSLPQNATVHRGVVRNALKRHKRLGSGMKDSQLAHVLKALNEYIPYILAIDAGLSNKHVAGEELEITLRKELEVEWRPVLSSQVPGRDVPRVKLRGTDCEVVMTLSTACAVHCLISRAKLHDLYNAETPTDELRSAAVSTAMKHLLDANAIYTYLVSRTQHAGQPQIADMSPALFVALASLTLAEATIITVLKDDPYPAAIVQARNKNDTEWMYKAPSMPKVRAHLFARLCLAAADHASKGFASLGNTNGVTDSLRNYLQDLRGTARGKACRFLGIDAEASNRTGEAIAWLKGARRELGLAGWSGEEDTKSRKGLAGLKAKFAEKREDRMIEKGGDWGMDAGKFEEGKVLDMLYAKWSKMNDTVNVMPVPLWEPLLANLPSGREYHAPKPWTPPSLSESTMARLRAPADPDDIKSYGEDDDDSAGEAIRPADPVGAFPGTASSYRSTQASQYY